MSTCPRRAPDVTQLKIIWFSVRSIHPCCWSLVRLICLLRLRPCCRSRTCICIGSTFGRRRSLSQCVAIIANPLFVVCGQVRKRWSKNTLVPSSPNSVPVRFSQKKTSNPWASLTQEPQKLGLHRWILSFDWKYASKFTLKTIFRAWSIWFKACVCCYCLGSCCSAKYIESPFKKTQYHDRNLFAYQYRWSMQRTMCKCRRWHDDHDGQTATVTVPKITIASLKLFFYLNLAISVTSLSIVLWLESCIEIYNEIPKKCNEIPN